MNQDTISDAVDKAAQQSRNFVSRQLDRQAKTLGEGAEQAARDLEQMGQHLRDNGGGPVVQVVEWAARYVDEAGAYLRQGNTDTFIRDLESFSRQRPWAVTTVTAGAGFLAARVIKASSIRRLRGSDSHYSSRDEF